MIHPSLRTALLPRELLNKAGRNVQVSIGEQIPIEQLSGAPDEQLMDHMQMRVNFLRHREQGVVASTIPRSLSPIAASISSNSLAAEAARLPAEQVLARSGDCAVYTATAGQIPGVLRELGRLRELSFRAAGEGSGKSQDLDIYDRTYRHLFIWNARREEIIGAYRC
jgi:hypothetical protein